MEELVRVGRERERQDGLGRGSGLGVGGGFMAFRWVDRIESDGLGWRALPSVV